MLHHLMGRSPTRQSPTDAVEAQVEERRLGRAEGAGSMPVDGSLPVSPNGEGPLS